MPNELFVPRAALVDDAFWIETPPDRRGLHRAVAREEPPRWVPRVVLYGESGVGRTTLARRFVRATQRSVACDLVARRLDELDLEQVRRDQEARTRLWAAEMVRRQGHCPGACSPAAWIPENVLATLLEQAQRSRPTEMLDMAASRNSALGFLLHRAWRSLGNDANDPVRRTSLALVDNADRLLGVSKAKRRACLDQMEHVDGVGAHRIVNVYLGSPELAEALAECGATQAVTLRPMPCDAVFARVCEMVFGPVAGEDLARLHRVSGGRMGPPSAPRRHARPRAPYAVPDDGIRRLPSPIPSRVDAT